MTKTKQHFFLFLFLILLFAKCFSGAELSLSSIQPECNDSSSRIDPLYNSQWHLHNKTHEFRDINVLSAWDGGIKGEGVNIAIVDDGLDINHEDLKANIDLSHTYNYLDASSDTTGKGECEYVGGASCHGTAVAGVAAAVENNSKGGRGAAPCASLMAFSLLQDFTSENQQNAMIRSKSIVGVSNNSWGPPDYTGQLFTADFLWTSGVEEGIETGREGKGILYTWAAGNGGTFYKGDTEEVDSSNYDEYANFYGVMAVGAIADDGKRSYYSERGSNLWVSTYSDGGSRGIVTTDVSSYDGYNEGNYTAEFGGTSSAAPLAAGIAALVLEVNPDFTWRDLKMILALSAKKIDAEDLEWEKNASGLWVNYKYGFGSIDASAAVSMASSWSLLSPMLKFSTPVKTVNALIPDENTLGIQSTINITEAMTSSMNKIEYIDIPIKINHPETGDLEIILISPEGSESILAESHSCYDDKFNLDSCSYFNGGATFRFATARHLNEDPIGTWTLIVKDLWEVDVGSLMEWSMKFYGREE